ncbi:MAG: twin-arginine translocase TatA/TatE family subunit [Bryobacterales bacterium]|nr:twin-arginine translocase TatA/TatE family subunit [Bryobacterales bacterium]MDE0625470.1 twin-arginine translocase TatA/TatE family subunit [Bryobacterales bacterium]
MQELLVVLLIALVIFGGKKIPELGRGLGDGIRQFKSSLKGEDQAEAAVEEKSKAS